MATTYDEILLLGDDQIKSQAEIVFDRIPGFGAWPKAFSMRMDQTIDLPKEEVGTYETWYQGRKILKRSIIEQTEKTFDIPMRIAQSWSNYNAFKAWLNLVYDPISGEPVGNYADIIATMTVNYQGIKKADGTAYKIVQYKDTILVGLKIDEIDHQSGDPLRFTGSFIYGKRIELN